MAKVMRGVAKVAGVVAAVAGMAAMFVNPALGATLMAVSKIAMVVAAVSGTAAQLMAKRPPARGSPNNIMIGANMPSPIVAGRSYLGGHKVHDVGYGGKVGKVQNPYSFGAFVLSSCAPIAMIEAIQADFATIAWSGNAATGYYNGFLYKDTQLGALPEPDALQPYWLGAPGWSAAHKLSGYGAVGLSAKFDKDGKVFAAGEPQWGFIVKGVLAYDWRKDSTFPGGTGAHRVNDRSTWEWTENPAILAAQYAMGWFANGKKQGGVGIDFDGLYIEQWTAFANMCDANEWKAGGVLYEPGNKWENLVRICDAGSARPYFEGHRLGVYFDAPRVAIDTITIDDLADEETTITIGRTYRERVNTIVPKYRSEAHKWEYVSAEDVVIAGYVTDDGEEKREEITFELCQDKDQAAQLAAYELMNRREIGPIEIVCKPRLRGYSAGDMLAFDLPGSVLDGMDAVIVSPPRIDAETGKVTLTLVGDTPGKHTYALGRTGTAPPVPALLDGEGYDTVVNDNTATFNAQIVGLPEIVIEAATDGTPVSGQLPKTSPYKLYRDGVDVTASATWAVAQVSGASTQTVTGGSLSVSVITTNAAAVEITATLDGYSVKTQVKLTKRIAQPNINVGGGGGTAQTDNSFEAVASATMLPISDELVVKAGAAGEVNLTAPLTYNASPTPINGSTSTPAYLIWRRWDGAAWVNVGTESAAGPEAYNEWREVMGLLELTESFDGQVTATQLVTGLTPATDYGFRLFARSDGTMVYFTGTAAAEGR